MEYLAAQALRQWDDEAINLAIVVLRNSDASYAAYLGGAAYGAEPRAGFVDLAEPCGRRARL